MFGVICSRIWRRRSASEAEMTILRRIVAALSAVALVAPSPAQGQDVVAVLSSELRPYVEAYEAFRESFGQPVPVVSLTAGEPRIGEGTRAVVAFGSKAAQQDYESGTTLIYCMAPATLSEKRRRGTTIRVSMLPQANVLADGLLRIQPQLRRLAVFWQMDGYGDYVERLRLAAEARGFDVVGTQLPGPESVPAQLRELTDADALWLPPDPLLINAQSFAVVREFSRATSMPLYAPTYGFVAEGAVASIAVGYAQAGREVASVVRRLLDGESVPDEVYPTECEISLNLPAAEASGLRIPAAVIEAADEVVR